MTTKSDILIIGGGPVGLSCAYYLLKSGRKVTILEAKEIGKGSGHGNAGQIVPSHIIPLAAPGVVSSALKWMLDPALSPFGMKVRLSPAYLLWLVQFAAACNDANVQRSLPAMRNLAQLSVTNLQKMLDEEGIECRYQQTGIITLFKDEKAFEGGKHEAEFLGKNGVPTEILDKAALHAREPIALDDVIGGVHFTGDSFMNPAIFLGELAKRVRAMGAEVHENTPVTGLESAGGKISKVRTASGEFEAEHVVLAAGAWSPIVARDLRLKLPVQPARGYSVTVAAPRKMPRHAFILGDRRVAVSPLGELLRFTGRLEVGEYSTTPNPDWLARLEKFVREYIELDEKLDVKETWAGLRPVTPDGIPAIGRSPHHSNLTVATGHAMVGLTLGPGTGQVVTELVNGRKTAFDLSPFGLERF
ncbi:MAG: FAD-dependent oxidoreductase [Chloroflexi bacterium]|nr:FAD-dependent oxidoreductase [Chloroflexota bacterium]